MPAALSSTVRAGKGSPRPALEERGVGGTGDGSEIRFAAGQAAWAMSYSSMQYDLATFGKRAIILLKKSQRCFSWFM
jgi:hypothetical protein